MTSNDLKWPKNVKNGLKLVKNRSKMHEIGQKQPKTTFRQSKKA